MFKELLVTDTTGVSKRTQDIISRVERLPLQEQEQFKLKYKKKIDKINDGIHFLNAVDDDYNTVDEVEDYFKESDKLHSRLDSLFSALMQPSSDAQTENDAGLTTKADAHNTHSARFFVSIQQEEKLVSAKQEGQEQVKQMEQEQEDVLSDTWVLLT